MFDEQRGVSLLDLSRTQYGPALGIERRATDACSSTELATTRDTKMARAGAPGEERKVLRPVEVDRLADEIAELAARLDAGTHRLLTLIRRLDEGSGWYTQGAISCAQWLSWRIGLDVCAAREKV